MQVSTNPGTPTTPPADENFYLLYDLHTGLALWATENLDAAAALCMYSTRIWVVTVNTANKKADVWAPMDFRNPAKNYRVNFKESKREIEPVENQTLPRELIEFKRVIKMRGRRHELLSSFFEHAATGQGDSKKFIEYLDSIIFELNRCDPSNDKFSPGVEAYAENSGCDPRTAYEELSMQVENVTNTRMRNLGSYVKFRNMLNDAGSTEEEQLAVMALVRKELSKNSLI